MVTIELNLTLNRYFIGLPPGETEGHRTRFQEQFRRLRQFYIQSSNLQYFKTLIQIPILAEV